MEITLFHVWEKVEATDPSFYPTAPDEAAKTVTAYRPFTTVLDIDHAKHICSNSDGRYVFTSAIGYYAAN